MFFINISTQLSQVNHIKPGAFLESAGGHWLRPNQEYRHRGQTIPRNLIGFKFKCAKNVIFLSKFLLGKKVTTSARYICVKTEEFKEQKNLISELLEACDEIHLP